MKHKNHRRSIDVNMLLIFGLIILTFSLLWKKHETTKLSFVPTNLDVSQVEDIAKLPQKVSIESIGLSLPIYETVIHQGIWKVSDDGISHLATSSIPQQNGNIILYGHNTKDRLASLPRIKKGDVITLTTKEGKQYRYTVFKTTVVRPSQVGILEPENTHELTIYTCYGFADLERFVVKAIPTS